MFEKTNIIEIDHPNNPYLLEEVYKQVDRRNYTIKVKNLQLAAPVLFKNYQDYTIENNEAIYPKVDYGPSNTTINGINVSYIRELPNRAYRNERSIELGLGKYFAEKFNNEIVELGAVCYQYSFFKGWNTIDPYDSYEKCIRKDILEYNYCSSNLLSISTLEHCGLDLGYNQPKDENLAITGLKKIIGESNNYLVTFPIGVHRKLEDYVKNNLKDYIILKRKNPRGEPNEWEVHDRNDFNFNYLHFSFGLSYYGSAHAICVVTSLKELL